MYILDQDITVENVGNYVLVYMTVWEMSVERWRNSSTFNQPKFLFPKL